jgi:predicted DNA-binding ribbon-helix-helix protein
MDDRTFTVAGRRIHIKLEKPFWECLEDLADEQDLSLSALVEMIGRKSELDLTIALRLYVFEDVLQKAGCTLTATPASCEPSLKYH